MSTRQPIQGLVQTAMKLLQYTHRKKWGTWSNLSDTGADGHINSLVTATGGGAPSTQFDNVEGKGRRYPTGVNSGDNGGIRGNTPFTTRAYNPRVKFKFRLNSIAVVRQFFGFSSSTISLTSDDPLNAVSGVLFGMTSGATNFKIFHNDGTGVTIVDDTGIPADTNRHVVEIIGDDVGAKFLVIIDGATVITVNADIPAQTTQLTIQCEIETAEAVAKNFDLFALDFEADK